MEHCLNRGKMYGELILIQSQAQLQRSLMKFQSGWSLRMKSLRELNSDASVAVFAPPIDDTANSISSPVREVPSPVPFGSLSVLLLADVGPCL